MQYILQVFTGGWHNANYSAEDIIKRLSQVITVLPVKKVIIGWLLDAELYKKVGAFLKQNGIEMLLWLPVFSEIGELTKADESLDLWGRQIGSLALQEGENFVFYCPTSERNIQNVFSVYETYFSEVGFDGVFLDKIRTQSFVGGVGGVLSCGCERCQKAFSKMGVVTKVVAKAYDALGSHFFDLETYHPIDGFSYKNKTADAFMQAKGQIIADSVTAICDYFKKKNMQVGLDLYAPIMSKVVGQNYAKISAHADFIKPMLYRKTMAPAGIGYEYDLMLESVGDCNTYPKISMEPAFLKEQIAAFMDLPCEKYPGIEINYREDIARTNAAYVKESMEILQEMNMNGAVLSWDVMLAPDAHLQAICEAQK